MKWYWIVLIVIVAIAIGFIIAKAMKPKVAAVGIRTTTNGVKPVVANGVTEIATTTDPTGKKTILAVKG